MKRKKIVKHKTSRKKNFSRKKFLWIFGLFVFIVSIFSINYFLQTKSEIRIKAAGPGCKCSDPNACHPDGCSRDVSKINGDCGGHEDLGPEPGTVDQTLCVKPPDCCSGGGNNCCWIERGFCTPTQCGGSTKGGCGWYWAWHDGQTSRAEGYGCMIGDSPDKMKPKFGDAPVMPTKAPLVNPTNPPTQPPAPTNVPVIEDTQAPEIPTEIPTAYIPPTESFVQPTSPPYNPPVYIQPARDTSSFSPQPTSVPTPTPKPVIEEYVKNFQNFVQDTKTSIIDFLSKVLP